jgi:arabinoxylan arabinofuranohydrolase
MGRAGRPTCLGYATSRSPMGPFKYGGVIIDNDHCDPESWNNHGSLVEFNKQWYVFYHRSTHGSKMMRKACVEPIFFNKDGSINEVEMTTQGAGKPLDATQEIDAERACLLYGNVRISAISENNEALTQVKNGDSAGYKYIDFKAGVDNVEFRIIPGKSTGKIDIVLDNSWDPAIGSINVPAATDGQKPVLVSSKINNVKGVHAVWLRMNSADADSFKIDWFKFQ